MTAVDRIAREDHGRWRVTTNVSTFELDLGPKQILWRPWVDRDVIYRVQLIEDDALVVGRPKQPVFWFECPGQDWELVWDEVGVVQSIEQVDDPETWTAPEPIAKQLSDLLSEAAKSPTVHRTRHRRMPVDPEGGS